MAAMPLKAGVAAALPGRHGWRRTRLIPTAHALQVTAAIVTCGGLCPGLNDVVQNIVYTLNDYGVPEDQVQCRSPSSHARRFWQESSFSACTSASGLSAACPSYR